LSLDNAASQASRPINDDDYRALASFRHTLRKFLAFSESAAMAADLMPQQHQALLAIKGMSLDAKPSVGEIAEKLFIKHHSAVELIGRLARTGMVERTRDPLDGRRVLIGLTPLAEEKLAALSVTHLQELRAIKPLLAELLGRFDEH